MDKHISVLGILYIVFHAVGLVVGIFLFGILSGTGVLSGDLQAAGILTLIGAGIGFLLVTLCAPGVIGGVGLLYRKSWARWLALIVGFLNLLDIPFGTALGVYTIWVLTNDEAALLLDR